MTAHDSVRAIVAGTLVQWGVTRDAFNNATLDTASHKGKARLSLDKKSAVKVMEAPGRARFALGHVKVRSGHTLELAVPTGRGADLVAGRLEIEPGGTLIVEEGSRFAVDELVAGPDSQLGIKLRSGKDGLDGSAKYPAQNGGNAPAMSGLPFLAAAITGTFTLKITGGNGGKGGAGAAGQNGGDGGDGTDVGTITILYGTSTMTGPVQIVVEGLKGGDGGAGGEGGQDGRKGNDGTVNPPVLAQMIAPKDATPATAAHNKAVAERPIFAKPSDDFANASRNQQAPSPRIVQDAQGNIVWDLNQYEFLDQRNPAPPTVNPSLWRNAQLNYFNGLYKITTDPATGWSIYQARGMDLAVVTFIEAANSFIVVDPLTTAQMAKAAWQLMEQVVPGKPIGTIIYSHTHVDHDGGVGGLVEVADTQGRPPKVKVVAPIGFMEEATSENVYAGNAMGRRATYMYGNILPRGPRGQTGAGLGLGLSTGTITLIAPNESIRKDVTRSYDGVEATFQLTPGTEAPAEMNIYFPGYKTLHIAENCTHTLHNIITLRGAKVRDALAWANYLTQSLEKFGGEADVMIAAHHWPTWGNAQIVEMIESQRDMYKYLNDQVLQLLNKGYTLTEIGNKMKLPPSLDDKWYNQGYYGTINHNSKAVYQRYIGWFDGVPAHLHPLDPVEEAKKYVEYMGGAAALLTRAQADFDKGEYRWVASVVNQVVFADSANTDAKMLLADTYEQLGYQATSAPWRNFYLGGAQELRNGVAILSNPNAGSADTLRAMSMEEFLTYVCILVDAEKAALFRDAIVIELDLKRQKPYRAERFSLRLKNSVLVFTEVTRDSKQQAPQAIVSTTRNTLNKVISGEMDFADGINDGTITLSGDDPQAALRFASCLVPPFNPWFAIVTP